MQKKEMIKADKKFPVLLSAWKDVTNKSAMHRKCPVSSADERNFESKIKRWKKKSAQMDGDALDADISTLNPIEI